ncbi:hypothetical protein NL676_021659 [Syzygium grande]|nr:hypothetical protein NL676_021659 [Syzygium grande]
MQRASPNSNLSTNSTALVLLNTRNLRDYKSLRDMIKPNSKSPWGNNCAFLHVPIPKMKSGDSQFSDPLKFVHRAREVIKRKQSSFGVVLTGKLLEIMKKCRGISKAHQQDIEKLEHGHLQRYGANGVGNHPIKGLYYTVAGTPESLGIMIFSYAGNLRVAVRAEQGFIDSGLYTHSLLDAFGMIHHDACGKQ